MVVDDFKVDEGVFKFEWTMLDMSHEINSDTYEYLERLIDKWTLRTKKMASTNRDEFVFTPYVNQLRIRRI